MSLTEWDMVIKKSLEHEHQQFQKRMAFWRTRLGVRVKHTTYLLLGTIVDVQEGILSTIPMIAVKWDNDAESLEIPTNIEPLEGEW